MKLDNIQDKDAIQEILLQGQQTKFWTLILQSLDQSIERLEGVRKSDDMKALPADEYKLESELIIAKIQYLEHLKELPATLIQYIQQPDQTNPNFDPYETVKELSERMKKEL